MTNIRRRTAERLWGWTAESGTDWDGNPGERLIGQADDGEWYIETAGRWRPLRLRNPRHLAAFLRSRRRRRVVFLERA